MIISDLNYLEVVTESSEIEGGSYKKKYYYSDAKAKAYADAAAIGGKYNTAYTKTYADAYTAPYFASASSYSKASATTSGY
jgi:hypothetical protein